KEYLQFIADRDEPLLPLKNPLMFPVIGNFPIVNKPMLDLLGVHYLMQPSDRSLEQDGWGRVLDDPAHLGFDCTAGGVRKLHSYSVYEIRTPLPRAFVVYQARMLPEQAQVLERLKNTDFRKEVLLEGDTNGYLNIIDKANDIGQDSLGRRSEPGANCDTAHD